MTKIIKYLEYEDLENGLGHRALPLYELFEKYHEVPNLNDLCEHAAEIYFNIEADLKDLFIQNTNYGTGHTIVRAVKKTVHFPEAPKCNGDCDPENIGHFGDCDYYKWEQQYEYLIRLQAETYDGSW